MNEALAKAHLAEVLRHLDKIEQSLEKLSKGEELDLPFAMTPQQEGIWRKATESTYLHVLEMCSSQHLARFAQRNPTTEQIVDELKDFQAGLHIVFNAMNKMRDADANAAPLPLMGAEASLWTRAATEAYRHCHEILSQSTLRAATLSQSRSPTP